MNELSEQINYLYISKIKIMIIKEKLLNSLKNMPEFSIDELMDKLVLLQKIETGLKQSKKGEVYPTQEAKEMLKQWSK